MILFFRTPSKSVIAVESNHQLTPDESNKLCWLFGEAVTESEENLKGCFVVGRRRVLFKIYGIPAGNMVSCQRRRSGGSWN